MMESLHALYLYCLARRSALAALAGAGVDDEHSVDLVPFEDVVAVVSVVRVNDFCGSSAEARLRDIAWVGPRVCRHEAVVERAMRRSPVVPVRFAVLFSSEERLAMWLSTHRGAISQTLDRLTDHEEWAVKGALDRRRAEARLLASAVEPRRDTGASSPGARYFEERRMRAAVGRELSAWLGEVRPGIAAALLDHAVEFRERDVVTGASEEDGAPILNWAFLVKRSALGAFVERVQEINAEHAERGLVLRVSGPWPPYSFCPPLELGPSE